MGGAGSPGFVGSGAHTAAREGSSAAAPMTDRGGGAAAAASAACGEGGVGRGSDDPWSAMAAPVGGAGRPGTRASVGAIFDSATAGPPAAPRPISHGGWSGGQGVGGEGALGPAISSGDGGVRGGLRGGDSAVAADGSLGEWGRASGASPLQGLGIVVHRSIRTHTATAAAATAATTADASSRRGSGSRDGPTGPFAGAGAAPALSSGMLGSIAISGPARGQTAGGASPPAAAAAAATSVPGTAHSRGGSVRVGDRGLVGHYRWDSGLIRLDPDRALQRTRVAPAAPAGGVPAPRGGGQRHSAEGDSGALLHVSAAEAFRSARGGGVDGPKRIGGAGTGAGGAAQRASDVAAGGARPAPPAAPVGPHGAAPQRAAAAHERNLKNGVGGPGKRPGASGFGLLPASAREARPGEAEAVAASLGVGGRPDAATTPAGLALTYHADSVRPSIEARINAGTLRVEVSPLPVPTTEDSAARRVDQAAGPATGAGARADATADAIVGGGVRVSQQFQSISLQEGLLSMPASQGVAGAGDGGGGGCDRAQRLTAGPGDLQRGPHPERRLGILSIETLSALYSSSVPSGGKLTPSPSPGGIGSGSGSGTRSGGPGGGPSPGGAEGADGGRERAGGGAAGGERIVAAASTAAAAGGGGIVAVDPRWRLPSESTTATTTMPSPTASPRHAATAVAATNTAAGQSPEEQSPQEQSPSANSPLLTANGSHPSRSDLGPRALPAATSAPPPTPAPAATGPVRDLPSAASTTWTGGGGPESPATPPVTPPLGRDPLGTTPVATSAHTTATASPARGVIPPPPSPHGATMPRLGGTMVGSASTPHFLRPSENGTATGLGGGCFGGGSGGAAQELAQGANPASDAEAADDVDPITGRPRPGRPWRSLRGCRILLVEDNVINQKVAVRVLSSMGVEAQVASDGERALAAVAAAEAAAAESARAAPAPDASDRNASSDPIDHFPPPFDVVLMDMLMPVLDGLGATRALRGRGFSAPIVAMTANASEADRDACRTVGMDGFIPKPVLKSSLLKGCLAVLNGESEARRWGEV